MKNKLNKVIVIIPIIFMCLASVVFASSFKFTAKAEREVINIGDTVIVDMSIDEIDAGEEGINVVEMWFEYDKDVFENVEFIETNNWRIVYNEETGKLLIVKMVEGVKVSEKIGQIKLKSRNDLEDIDTEIKLKEVTSNDGYELISEGDRVIKIRIEKEAVPTPTPTSTPTSEPKPTSTPTPVPTAKQTPTPTPIPTKKPIIQNINTGDIKPIIAIVIIAVVILANVIYFVVKKIRKKDKE